VLGSFNFAGFEAYDFPQAGCVAHVNARVTVPPGEVFLFALANELDQGSNHGSDAVDSNLSVGSGDFCETKCAAAEAGDGLLFGLDCALGGDGGVVIGEQDIQGRAVVLQDGGAPGVLHLVDFMTVLVFVGAGRGNWFGNQEQRGSEDRCGDRKQEPGQDRDSEERFGAHRAIAS